MNRASSTIAAGARLRNDLTVFPRPPARFRRPLLPLPSVKRLLFPVMSAMLLGSVLASCGGGSSSGGSVPTKSSVNPKYSDFCLIAADLDAKSNATHGEDPTAMSDPAKMKSAWATIIESSRKLLDAAPLDIKSDVKTMLEGMTAMDKVYAAYNYNLAEMKAVSNVAEQLNTIANDATIADASRHFKTWMTANCGL